MLLWFLWLRKGRIGTLASGLRVFDQLNKPARKSLLDRPVLLALLLGLTNTGFSMISLDRRLEELKAKDAKATSVPDPPKPADETGDTLPGDAEENATNSNQTQEETPANQPTPEEEDKNPGNGKD